jgi:hypothetical protein
MWTGPVSNEQILHHLGGLHTCEALVETLELVIEVQVIEP